MGLISAAIGSAATTLGDTFKEVVTCPEVSNDVIIQRGVVNHGSGNFVYSEGVISKGSKIIVPQGMAMMIIDNGQIVEFTDTPGDYSWDSSTEPSIFSDKLGKSIVDSIKTIGKRITYGEYKDLGLIIIDEQHRFGVKQRNILKNKFSQKISEAINDVMTVNNISFNRIQGQRSLIADKMNTLLNADWHEKYGIIVAGEVTININASEEAKAQIREIDKVRGMAQADAERVGVMSDAYSKNLQGAMAASTGEAMLHASQNENGGMAAFMGMGMAQQQGANMLGAVSTLCPKCGNAVEGKFCANCGTSIEAIAKCPNCGTDVKPGNKFCTECGQKLS